MGRQQRIRDPIHDLIEFNGTSFEQICWKVLQTPPFQRLRRIKQLGFSDLVYPGATHSRFAHSVGVFHTARQLVRVLKGKLGNEFKSQRADTAIAAALLHDVGHGPFSHSFEGALKSLDIKRDHESWTAQIIRETAIANILNEVSDSFADQVAKMIEQTGTQNIYSSIVSSQFDADRLDYMRRDRMMSGTQHSAIDFSWLLANLEVRDVPNGLEDTKLPDVQTFVLGQKARYAAEAYVLGLFQLYPTVYYHKTTRGAEKLFSQMICQIGHLVRDKKYDWSGLPKNHPLIRFFSKVDDREAYLSLDDSSLWGSLELLRDAKCKIISEIAGRFLERCFFKAIDINTGLGASDPEQIKREAEIDQKLQDSGLLNGIECLPSVLTDRAVRDPYKRRQNGKSALSQIYGIDSDESVKDLSEISEVVKSMKTHRHYRIYVKDEDTKKKVQKIISNVGERSAR